MKIGIDIDDTITDSWQCLIPHYSRMFNVDENTLYQSKPYYESVKDKISLSEYYEIMRPVYDTVIPNVNLLDNVKDVIDKLYDLGCSIYFITARGVDHTDAYKDSKDFLDKHHIKYEKIYTGSSDKAKVCLDEGINLFIDDSYRHCDEVSKVGIPVLMHETIYNKEYNEFTHFADWQDVYEYVKRWQNG